MFKKFDAEKKYVRILAAVLAATVILSESGMAMAAENSSRAATRKALDELNESGSESVSVNDLEIGFEMEMPEDVIMVDPVGVSENALASEDENATGYDDEDDDDDDDEDDEEREFVEYDGDAIASELEDSVNDPTAFFATPVIISGKPAVKIAWNIKGGKEYTVDRIDADGSVEHLEVRITKKVIYDKEVWDEAENCAIYRLRATLKTGEMLEYVTIPTAQILDGQTGSREDTIDIVFTRSHGPFKYIIERSYDKDFDSVTGFDVYDENVTEDGDGVMGKSKTLYGRPALSFKDTDSDLQDHSTHYYRVTPTICLDELEGIYGATSKSKKITDSLFAAPVIKAIKNDDDEHTLCYKHGYFLIYFPDADTDEEDAKLVIERATGTTKKYKTIKSIPIEDLETYEDEDSGIEMFKIDYDKFYPETTYYYRAKLMIGKKSGAYSQPKEVTCHFAPIDIVDSGEKTASSVFITWLSDDCATKYYIYRSKDTWDNKADAIAEGSKYPKNRFTKIATVKNKTARSEDEITFTDRKAQQIGVYHAYRVIPANKKMAAFTFCDDDNFVACKAYPDSPKSVDFESDGLSRMVVKWNKVSGAVAYRVDRTDCLDVDGQPIWEDIDGVEYKSWEFGKNDVYSRETSTGFKTYKPFVEAKLDQFVGDGEYDVEQSKHYYYRVLAAVKENGVVTWTTDTDSYLTAATQPKTVKNLKLGIGTNTTDFDYNYPLVSFTLEDDWKDIESIQVGFSSKRGSRLKEYEKHLFSITPAEGTHAYGLNTKIVRGSRYFMAVRTVHENEDGEEVYGKWVEQKLVLPTEIKIYPEGHDETYTTSTAEPYIIYAGNKKTVYIKYYPDDTTYYDLNPVKPVLSSTTYFAVSNKTYPSKKNNGIYYFNIEARSSSSYYSGSATLTVTAKNLKRDGDDQNKLVRKMYLAYRRSTSSSSSRSSSRRTSSSRRYY